VTGSQRKVSEVGELHIADSFHIPAEAVTHTFGLLGMRGSGKSNVGVVLAEEMYKAGLHWVAIDPKGDWFGIRSSADGKSPGLPVVIFGGQHGDLPLEPDAGAFIAELILEQTITCVIDLSEFTEGEKIRFLAGHGREDGFAARFYRRKKPDQPPTHIFFEEADDALPQRVMRDKAKLMHDCSRLLLWGRQRGVGGTIITQRSARVHKDVLTQTETLIVLRTTAPQDRDAVKAWVEYHGQAKTLIDSLPQLSNGEGWIWSPEWLKAMEKVHFRRRQTFDSGSTPLIGAGRTEAKPATLAEVNLKSIEKQMAATIEKAKAEDPRELRGQIAERDRRIAELERMAGSATPDPQAIEAARGEGIRKAEEVLGRFRLQAASRFAGLQECLNKGAEELLQIITDLNALGLPEVHSTEFVPKKLGNSPLRPTARPHDHNPPRPSNIIDRPQSMNIDNPRPDWPRGGGSSSLPAGERAVLNVLAQYPDGAGRSQISILTGYKRSTRDAYIQRLAERGYADAGRGDKVYARTAGKTALGPGFQPLPRGAALQEYWRQRLPDGERAILEVLLRAGGRPVKRTEIDERTKYKRSSRDAYIQRLKARKLVEEAGPGAVKASEVLFR
jgi:uncharacterized protein